MSENYILELIKITKSFPGVLALNQVTMRVRAGEVHALVGENGAGKSTLLKIMFGVMPPDSGKIIFAGREISLKNPSHAQKLGISLVHQELQQIPELSVTQNIFLGRELTNWGGLFINFGESHREAQRVLQRIGIDVNLRLPIKNLSIAQRQMVEIAKALLGNARVIAFDEPTSSLTNVETENLFNVIRDLREHGVGIIYVSHRLEEVMQIADRVTVLRDGKLVGEALIKDINLSTIVSMMVGKANLFDENGEGRDEVTLQTQTEEVKSKHSEQEHKGFEEQPQSEEVLRVVNLRSKKLKGITFSLYKGEILGIAGLVGSGRTETVRAIYGADPAEGEIYLYGNKVSIRSPRDAIRLGIGFLPEDRKVAGLLQLLSVKLNITITSLPKMGVAGIINYKKITRESERFVESLQIHPPQLDRIVLNLSGGNQQKVILARWLLANSNIIIFDEPTRGIDVGTKAEIYRLMHELLRQGKSIIMVSSELPEILHMSDRVLVMHDGELVKILPKSQATQELILYYASGGK